MGELLVIHCGHFEEITFHVAFCDLVQFKVKSMRITEVIEPARIEGFMST